MPFVTLDTVRLYTAVDTVRLAKDLSWRQVAKETGLSPSTFTRLASGDHAPDADALLALLVWLGRGGAVEPFLRREASRQKGDQQ
jgi:transcriptional regulator with XRE-family HTH domain